MPKKRHQNENENKGKTYLAAAAASAALNATGLLVSAPKLSYLFKVCLFLPLLYFFLYFSLSLRLLQLLFSFNFFAFRFVCYLEKFALIQFLLLKLEDFLG